jgi:hypothetical protein
MNKLSHHCFIIQPMRHCETFLITVRRNLGSLDVEPQAFTMLEPEQIQIGMGSAL